MEVEGGFRGIPPLYFFLIFFFDFLSFEGIFGAAGTLDPPPV